MELFTAIIHSVLVSFVLAGAGVHWTYKEGSLDERHWPDEYPSCGGRKQSPIDIKRLSVQFNPKMLQLELSGYGQLNDGNFLMTNNGHSVQINLPSTMMITKGLPNRYTAVQMHLHWGGWDLEASGSEHTVDGIRYMAELHVVHFNSDKYADFEEAKDKPDGLAVLAFFYEDGHFENTYYSDFIHNLENVKYAGQSMNISTLNVRSMLPENLSHFFRYEGSLTTPPCFESILWTVFDSPITLSHNQIRKLESTLMDLENKTLWNDYRIAQPLNDRIIESSFLPRWGKGTFCRQEEIEMKLSNIESMITLLGKNIQSDGGFRPNNKGLQAIFPLVLNFPASKLNSYAMIHLDHPMNLHSFTVCMNLRMNPRPVHTVLSYSTSKNENELAITMGYEVGLWIGNEFVNLQYAQRPHNWAHYCLTWSSHTGGAELWVNGAVGQQQYLRSGYTISPGGDLILGKDQDGFLGISDSDSFVGLMTDLNIWDYVLSPKDIQEEVNCEKSSRRLKGSVLNWGVTRISLYGGVQLETENKCA